MKLKAEIENICGDDECGEILYADEDVDANQLISYTGNIPDFEYITMPKLEGESSQEASPAPSVQSLHTPLVEYSADQCERTRSERADT